MPSSMGVFLSCGFSFHNKHVLWYWNNWESIYIFRRKKNVYFSWGKCQYSAKITGKKKSDMILYLVHTKGFIFYNIYLSKITITSPDLKKLCGVHIYYIMIILIKVNCPILGSLTDLDVVSLFLLLEKQNRNGNNNINE